MSSESNQQSRTKQRKIKPYGITETFNYKIKTRKAFYYIVGTAVKVGMQLFWKVTYEDTQNVPLGKNFILMPNHLSHLDGPLVGLGLYPHPMHAIADEKLFVSPLWRFVLTQLNAFPIRKNAKQTHVIKYAMELVRNGHPLVYFPEGQRNKYPERKELMPGKIGAGWIAHATQAYIVPVFIDNTELAWPLGSGITIGSGPRKIHINIKYGKPLSFPELYNKPESPEISKQITDRIMRAIEALRPAYHQKLREKYLAAHPELPKKAPYRD